jgi:hypothetical protein
MVSKLKTRVEKGLEKEEQLKKYRTTNEDLTRKIVELETTIAAHASTSDALRKNRGELADVEVTVRRLEAIVKTKEQEVSDLARVLAVVRGERADLAAQIELNEDLNGSGCSSPGTPMSPMPSGMSSGGIGGMGETLSELSPGLNGRMARLERQNEVRVAAKQRSSEVYYSSQSVWFVRCVLERMF